jgi:hypothetical protein
MIYGFRERGRYLTIYDSLGKIIKPKTIPTQHQVEKSITKCRYCFH